MSYVLQKKSENDFSDFQKILLNKSKNAGLNSRNENIHGKLLHLFTHNPRTEKYDSLVQQVFQAKKYDSSFALAAYELTLGIDQRIVQQWIQRSQLRSSFVNYRDEKMFYEFTGVPYGELTWVTKQIFHSGEPTGLGAKDPVPFVAPSDVKKISSAISTINRYVETIKEGYNLTLEDIALAQRSGIDLNASKSDRVILDLNLKEQRFAFFDNSGTKPEEKGLLNAIPVSNYITATQVPKIVSISNATTTGVEITNMFNAIESYVVGKTNGVFLMDDSGNQRSLGSLTIQKPFCVILNMKNVKLLGQAYSQFGYGPVLDALTARNIRVGQVTSDILTDDQMIVYYNDPMLVELQTVDGGVVAEPQGYSSDLSAYQIKYRLGTAGLFIKVPTAVYLVTGIA